MINYIQRNTEEILCLDSVTFVLYRFENNGFVPAEITLKLDDV